MDAEPPVRAGVIGTGSMGAHHARVYRDLQGVELAGVVDADTDRATKIADRYGTSALSQEGLLGKTDVVSVAVPTEDHYRVVRACLESGVHTLVEKPITTVPAEAEDIVEIANERNLTVQVGHIERFNPAVMALERILVDHEVLAVETRRLGPRPSRDIHENVVIDLMIHDIYVLQSLVEPSVDAVTAMARDEYDHVTATVRFDGGVIGSLTTSRITQRKIRKLLITTSNAYLELDYLDQSINIYRGSAPKFMELDHDVQYHHEGIVEQVFVENTEPLKNQLASFVDSVRTGDPPRVTAEDGLRALEVAVEVEKASA